MSDEKLKQRAIKILESGYLVSLGVVDKQGVWVADVIFTFDDELNIYWMSKPERRHSRVIDGENAHVAGTITLTSGPEDPDAGLQLSGTAMRVSQIPSESVLRYFRKRKKPEPKPEDDILGEHAWYKLTPDRIELIFEEEFGHERQKVL